MKQDYKVSVAPEKLKASAQTREDLLSKWGFDPTSFWYFQKIHNATLDSLVEDTIARNSYPENNYNCRDGALSQTNPQVMERLIRFYSEAGDTVLNPFCGRAAYNIIANYFSRHTVGQDICKKFMDHNFNKIIRRVLQAETLDPEGNGILFQDATHLKALHKGFLFELILADSRHLEVEDSTVDFIITSPPYYNLEIYSDDPSDLGRGTITGKGDEPTYEEFLIGLGEVFKDCYRVLRAGKFMAVIVNSFRLDGKFIPYYMDVAKLCQDMGWIYWDEIFYNLSNHPLQSIFSSQLARDHHVAKQHEAILIFKKPEAS